MTAKGNIQTGGLYLKTKGVMLLLFFACLRKKTNTTCTTSAVSEPVAQQVLYWSSALYETRIRLQRRSRVEEQQQQEQKPRPTQNH